MHTTNNGKKRIVISGATGLLGRGLCRRLKQAGCRITALSRNPQKASSALDCADDAALWTPYSGSPALDEAIDGAHAVVHLAAESIGGARWNSEVKRKLFDSRVQGTRTLSNAILNAANPPEVFVSVSGTGYYGDAGELVVGEDAPAGGDFLAQLCAAWENEAAAAQAAGTRVVTPRFGIVLSSEGGALPKLALPVRLFAGGPVGSGRQWMPWIHIEDALRVLIFAIENEELRGAFAAVAPDLVRNAEFGAALARALDRPFRLPVPAWLLRIAVGEFAGTLLGGQRIAPGRLIEAGFDFAYPRIDDALRSALKRR